MQKRTNRVFFSFFLFIFSAGLFAQIPAEEREKIKSAIPTPIFVAAKTPRHILVFTRTEGYRHKSIPYGLQMLKSLAEKNGVFTIEHSEDYAVFTKENLQKFDAVLFLNTTGINLGDSKYGENLLHFVRSGKGFIGIHSATDNFDKWPQAAAMIGGRFAGHPWNSSGTWAVKLDEPDHPICAVFESKGFKISDEIYRIGAPFSRENCRVLISLDLDDKITAAAKGIRHSDVDLPIAWVKPFGKGRVFYSSFGHNNHIYWNEKLVAHYLAGIQYALGDLPAADFSSVEKNLRTVARYEYGQDRSHLIELNLFIRKSIADKAALSRLEKRFIAILKDKKTPLAAQQYICDRLSLMGTKESVKTLAKMLRNPVSFEFARFALERIPAPEAGKALLKSLKKVKTGHRIGVITSLGVRKEQTAIDDLGKLLLDKNPVIATAAVRALGEIAGVPAIEILTHAKMKLAEPVRANCIDALLNAADQQMAQGNSATAAAIYRALNTKTETAAVRRAAIRGQILAEPQNAAGFIVEILHSNELNLHAAVFSTVRDLPHDTDLSAVAELLKNSEFDQAAPLLTSLSAHKQTAVTTAVMDLARHENRVIRLAALTALQNVGNAESVEILAAAAADGGEGREIARQSLYSMRGKEIDARILQMIPQVEAPVKIELLKSIVERGIDNSESIVLATAGDENSRIRLESARVLRLTASSDILPQLITLLQKSEKKMVVNAFEKAIIAVAGRAADKQLASDVLLQALDSTADVMTAAALMSALADLGQNGALPVLLANFSNENLDRQNAAIRALAAWPDSRPLLALFKLVKSDKKDTRQILALRSYVELKAREQGNPEKLAADFRQAMKLAANVAEQKRVLAALAKVPTVEAAKLALTYTENADLQAEAGFAAVDIAAAAVAENPPWFAGILKSLVNENSNTTLQKKARKVLQTIKMIDGHIINWQVNGPYFAKNVDLFSFAFPPEVSMDSDSGWWKMPAITDEEDPWRLDLREAIGGSNRVAYLRTTIEVADAGRYKLELGSDDGVRLWVNGENVFDLNVMRGINPADNAVEVSLKKGRNTLFFKITQGSGGWGACARIRNLDGSQVDGLRVMKY